VRGSVDSERHRAARVSKRFHHVETIARRNK